MPKTKKRTHKARLAASEQTTTRNQPADTPMMRRPAVFTRGQSLQNAVFSAMVALGCWGLAFFFAFLYSDPNHYLYGGIMVLTAAGWSFIAARRWSSYRQRA